MNYLITQLGPADLEAVLELFDAVQKWLVERGLGEQWGDVPFSVSETQRERFGAWLESGRMVGVRSEGQVVGTLVSGLFPPDYAAEVMWGRARGGYLEAFAVRRGYAGQGVGAALLSWAEGEISTRGLTNLYLDCWAGNIGLRMYYRRAGFLELAPLTVGAWQGVLFQKALKAPLSPPATPSAKI